ncbi:ABC transporter permease subunit [Anaerocolumna sp. AGMB13025]|uniref:ABC transporter permease subunit n=1 Tax=Anaerocolumna sp. AGMB13025 TaxID=3039116 RepID=UPI00241F387A|nr:ABC transporter permease subunit [Anaerocolumna sp. AGMB13025]WFR59045.1 ABC transporter permease subunit [Anaerocolumna sp. AGMB13025]
MSEAIRKTDGTAGRRKGKKKTSRVNYIPFYFMMLPGIAYLIANNYIPMFGILIAFKKMDYTKGILGSDWCGLSNFEYLFKTKDAFIMIRNTLGYNLIFIALGLVTALSIAVMMTEIGKKKIAKFIQPAICFPNMISIIIVAYLVYAFLGSNGFINNTILHGNGIKWYNEAKYWPFILVIVNFWKSAGYSSIIYIASISGIDASLYEAAKLDGASKMQQIFKITLPIIKPMIVLMLLLSVSKIFNSDFGLFLQVPMNSGMLFSTTQTIDTYVYRSLMELHNVGMSSAASVFQSVIGFILVMVSNAFVRKIDSESALF